MNELYTYQRILEELLSAYEDYGGSRPDDASDAGIRMRVLAGQLFRLACTHHLARKPSVPRFRCR